MRIMIGYDGSECAQAAIADLTNAGLPRRAEALVVCAAESWKDLAGFHEGMGDFPPISAERATELQKQMTDAAAETAKKGAKLVLSHFSEWKVDTAVPIGSPYWSLITKAEEWKPDLAVVGSHGRSALSRWLMGSVSQTFVSHAPCSVRVGRKPRNGHGPVRIIVAHDGSSDAAKAVKALARRSWPKGSEAWIVTAVDGRLVKILEGGLSLAGAWADQTTSAWNWLEQSAHLAGRTLRESGLTAIPVYIDGDPKDVLIKEIERRNADCIFLGAKGRRGLARFLIGSVSASLSARAPCSVEIVR